MKKYFLIITVFSFVISLMACSTKQKQLVSQLVTKSEKKDGVMAVEEIAPTKIIEYKHINGIPLSLHVFNPEGHKNSDNRPAIVFFHGGGWNGGSPSHFYRQSQYLANKGMVAISAQYRVKKQHGTSPIESVKDGKSAMRWVRTHAKELGINPKMIAAGGGSAGGHVATATGTATAFEEAGEDNTVSFRPDVLVLFNPVFDNSSTGYGYDRVKDYWQQISPLHNITKDTPPMVGFFGELDTAIKLPAVYKFKQQVESFGGVFELHVYKNQPHGFFNKAKYAETVLAMDKFLTLQGYIQ